jgi:glycosyltransferase involved in cell wall biosynthesis
LIAKRILFINPNWNTYSEAWLHRMMQYFVEQIVGVACFNPLSKYWQKTIPVFNLGSYNIRLPFFRNLNFLFINRIIRRNKFRTTFEEFIYKSNPDIIFINFIGPAIYLYDFILKTDIPIIIHTHGVDVFLNAQSEYTGKKIHDKNYVNLVFELSKKKNIKFIVNSKFSLKYLKEFNIDVSKIYLKYFGVNIPEHHSLRMKNHMTILFLGRFVDFKGPDLVLKAFHRACELGFTGRLFMVGDGPLKPMCLLLNSFSKYSKNVSFFDPANATDVELFMKSADIFTMHNCYGFNSKQYEAFGVTLIEAMSYGLPVINGNIGGGVEIIDHFVDGILVEPFDINAHAQAFVMLQNNFELRKTISINAKEKIKNKFSALNERNTLNIILNEL